MLEYACVCVCTCEQVRVPAPMPFSQRQQSRFRVNLDASEGNRKAYVHVEEDISWLKYSYWKRKPKIADCSRVRSSAVLSAGDSVYVHVCLGICRVH